MVPKDKVKEIILRHDTLEKELSSGKIEVHNKKSIDKFLIY